MTNHDRLFKELITTFFVEFIELFFPEVLGYLEIDSLEFLDKEVFTDVTAGERHEVDIIVKARFRGLTTYFLILVENQANQYTKFGNRFFKYFARLYEEHDLPVYPIVIFLFDSPKRPEQSTHVIEFPDLKVVEFNFRVVQLNRLSWRDFLRHKNPVASALMAKMKMTRSERKQVKTECLRLMATLKLNPAKMQLIAGFVDTYLRLEPEEETWVREEIEKFAPKTRKKAMQIVTTWEQKGRAIGLQEGLQQGLQQGLQKEALALALRLLKRRFTKLSRATERRIAALSLGQLEALCEAVLDFQEAKQLQQWLAQQEPLKN
jgi:predicted transposase/invertase (TIGR01784 family)